MEEKTYRVVEVMVTDHPFLFGMNDKWMKMIFYDKSGITGMITYLGKNGYDLEVVRDNGEKLLSKMTSGQGVVHHIRSLDHQMKTKTELTDEEWALLVETFPWFAEHRPEVEGVTRRFLSGLLLYAIKEENKELTELIIRESSLDRKGIEKRETKNAAILEADCLEDDETLCVVLKPKRGGFIGGTWKNGSSYVFDGDRGYRIGILLKTQLTLRYSKLKKLKENWKKEEGFLFCELPEEKMRIIYRPWKGNKPGEKYYEFLILKEEKPVLQRKISHVDDFLKGVRFACDMEEKEQAARDLAEALRLSAADGKDRYMETVVKEFLGTVTEDECEFLFREDGRLHYVSWIKERKVEQLELLGGTRHGRSFFNRREQYLLKVLVDGNEGKITWYPNDPGHFMMEVYHHKENCVLNDEQAEYLKVRTELL